MTTTLDSDIIIQLKDSDINRPVQWLYQQYFESIVMLIRSNGGTEEDGADIFQETVLAFIETVKTNQFREESSVKTFLHSIARNKWLHELRTRGRRIEREVNYSNYADNSSYTINEQIFTKERLHALQSLYDVIGDTCKKILKGFYYDNLPMKELLKKFNYENEQVLRNRKSLCIKKLKDMLQKNQNLNHIFKNLLLYGN